MQGWPGETREDDTIIGPRYCVLKMEIPYNIRCIWYHMHLCIWLEYILDTFLAVKRYKYKPTKVRTKAPFYHSKSRRGKG